MMVHKTKRVLITVEMTEEQSANLRSALRKAVEYATLAATKETFSKEETEVMNDLRQSLLNA
jgi:hypothetical protein